MTPLAFDLKNIAFNNGEGSHATRSQRHRGLQLMARELERLGYSLPSAGSLKPKHIEALVGHWKGQGLTTGTLKNRMSWIRWWAAKVRKTSVLPRDNMEIGIERRATWGGNRAKVVPADMLNAMPERMGLALRLQMAFGLRLEESIKFRADVADQGGSISLQASWCKGGRARSIPLTHERQRALLDEVRALCGSGSLIPPGLNYVQFRKEVERETWAAGIRNMHGHRHWYAQWRYQALTGSPPPAAGGKTYETMTKEERAADYRARLTVSRELGHNRVEITDAYLGRRFATKNAVAA